jgi:hypothetical protein
MLATPLGINGNSSDSKSVEGDPTSEPKEKPSVLLNIAEPIDGSLTSTEDWCSSFLDQSSGNSQLWEF